MKKIKSAEEIYDKTIPLMFPPYIAIVKEYVIKAMEEYAAQFQMQVTDEEIEESSNEMYIEGNNPLLNELADDLLSYIKKGFIIGAKAMRDSKIGNKLTEQ